MLARPLSPEGSTRPLMKISSHLPGYPIDPKLNYNSPHVSIHTNKHLLDVPSPSVRPRMIRQI